MVPRDSQESSIRLLEQTCFTEEISKPIPCLSIMKSTLTLILSILKVPFAIMVRRGNKVYS